MSQVDKTKLRKLELGNLSAVMSTGQGRAVMYRLMSQAGVFRQSYAGATNETNFNEGRRSQGLFLMAEMIEASSDLYLQMMKENTNGN